MAIDFPNSPATNDTFTSGGRTWQYNGSAWTLLTLTQNVIPANSVTSSSIVNDSIVNADINSAAAIAYSKLNISNSVVNSDINSSAAIALSKLASGTSGQIIVANSSGVPTWVSESGDVTISDTGVTAITSNTIVDADINSAAAISTTKITNWENDQIVLAQQVFG